MRLAFTAIFRRLRSSIHFLWYGFSLSGPAGISRRTEPVDCAQGGDEVRGVESDFEWFASLDDFDLLLFCRSLDAVCDFLCCFCLAFNGRMELRLC